MNVLKKVWEWVVYSSANANNYSLTLKGLLGTLGTIALLGVGIFHYTLAPEQVTNLTDALMVAVNATFTALSYVVTAVSAWAVVWGILRKFLTTMLGTNAVLNQ